MKKRVLFCLAASLMLTGCGKETIKEEDFEKAINNYIDSEVNDNGYEAKLDNGKMTITYDDEDYLLSYNLKGNPVITYEVKIDKGISYDDYSAKVEAATFPMIGYFAIANTYGVEFEDSNAYFYMTYLAGMFNSIDEDKDTYIITDDAEGFDSDAKIILTSEFGDKVIEFMKDSYENDVKIEDEENNTYTYDLSAECGKKSCTLTASLTVNPEGDFDKIKGYADELAKENMDENITEDNADYNIELDIGQTVTISGKKLTGYDLSGMDIVEVEDLDSKYTFTAKKAGIANGNFYLDEDGEDVRTFYLTVKESKKGNKVEDISLKIK